MTEQLTLKKPGDAKDSTAGPTTKVQGEGDYEAARRYNDSAREFLHSADVEQAARDAAPDSVAEATELERAETAGRSRAKEEDPLLQDPAGLGLLDDDDRTIVNHNPRR